MIPPPASDSRGEDRHALGAMRRAVVLMSLGFGAFLSVLALATHLVWLHRPFASLFRVEGLAGNMLRGGAIGGASAVVVLLIVRRLPGLDNFRRLARDGFEGIEPRVIDILIISLVAGWSEELFFRGVLQPRAGIWIAAAAFVLVHGAYGVLTRGGIALAVFLFIAGIGLGVLYNWRGLECAMCAHAAYDVVILVGLREMLRRGLWVARREDGRQDPADIGSASPGQ